jgi:4-hydroxybenzoate polyprenyltransferase
MLRPYGSPALPPAVVQSAPMRPFRTLSTVLEMIKFEHTLFALPFAFLGMLLAAGGWPSWRTVLWIVVAMVGARSAAMAFNRLVDRRIDAANPRTAGRALPAGLVTPAAVAAFTAASAGVLVLAAWQLNPLALALSPVALGILFLYSYTKRFTWAAHLFLGLSLSGAPLGAWIAVRGDVQATPLLIAGVVLTWTAGFDILYALQDVDFDRRTGLFSIPARFGVVGALWISAVLHALTLALLALLPRIYLGPPALGTPYWVGWAGCLLLICYQHWVVRPGDLSRLNGAFFTANGALSVWLFAATALDILSS